MMFQQMSNLNQRLTVSILGLVLVFVAIYFSLTPYWNLLFVALSAGIVGFAVSEFYFISQAKGVDPKKSIGVAGSVLYVLATFLTIRYVSQLVLPEIILALTVCAGFVYYLIKQDSPLINLAVMFFGIIYLTIPLTTLMGINYFFPSDSSQDGRWWLFYLLMVTKMTDTGAFFIGKWIGRFKLAPHISPGKTWEGAIGGLLSGVGTSVILQQLFHHFTQPSPLDLTLWQSVWLGCAISLIGQFGDLAESLLKRDGGVKDSNQLPGLGGMLDIVDSLVFTAPLLYFFLKMTH